MTRATRAVGFVSLASTLVLILFLLAAWLWPHDRKPSRCTHGESSISAVRLADGTFKVSGPHVTGCVSR